MTNEVLGIMEEGGYCEPVAPSIQTLGFTLLMT